MPLHVYKRPSGIYHVRGSVHGRLVDRSARTRSKREAEDIAAAWQQQIIDEDVLGRPRQRRRFAEAARGYLRSGGEGRYLARILEALGPDALLDHVDQERIDALASEIYPDAQPSTINRQLHTPISAVLTWAVDQGWITPRRIRRPKIKRGRIDWRAPAEIEALIDVAPPHLATLITALVGTGCRVSEMVNLDWRDVSPSAQSITLWDTKSNARRVDLQPRVRAVWPERRQGRVWRHSRSEVGWHSRTAIGQALRRLCAEHDLPTISPHVLRHTWATWNYACNRDLTHLMAQGGWTSAQMVMHYTHAGGPDLADQVRNHGWFLGDIGEMSNGNQA